MYTVQSKSNIMALVNNENNNLPRYDLLTRLFLPRSICNFVLRLTLMAILTELTVTIVTNVKKPNRF